MLKPPTPSQTELEMVTITSLVPSDHLLRKIDAALDFTFIRDRVAHLYCPDNGRPALDPVVLFKTLFIGYLFGIRSERQLMREVEVNVAYRWFLGLRLTDKVADASTLSQNRRRRFRDSTVYQDIFDEIVLQAVRAGLVDGMVLYTDSTHLKANANKNKYDLAMAAKSRADYLDALDQAIDADRAAHGKGPLKAKEREPEVKETKISRTDPDAGYMVRDGKPKGFFYLDHRTVDSRHAIITDSFVTPGNVHDSIPYLARLDRQRQRFDLDVRYVGLDAGYSTAGIAKGLEDRGIEGVIGYSRPTHRQGYLRKRDFKYDREVDVYRCPEGQELRYATTNREGYREYKSDPALCRTCPLLASCTSSANHTKVVTRHVWQDAKDHIHENRQTPWGKKVYARRKETVERSFADAKQLHGHRYARLRGLAKVTEQCLLAAAAQNIKKIATILARWRGTDGLGPNRKRFIHALNCLISELLAAFRLFHPAAI
ncbi:IS1182 family transposase [Nitrospirillum viridazoti]|uniref:IS5/IS1182 family transposase n=1 Tax=Nitrospirillum viridazoti CBAmc TaxID=1441467 RepID=A0A248JTH8_9PROT|nr:IS1182 family transposase [Nitrospirillum amazonense]ASG21418.1 IS5/IS1182 family transposase [Nitrospirillum amazonense CBAmc]